MRIYVDMDGVLVDFDGYKKELGLTGDQVKCIPGAYLAMKPVEGAIAGIRSLIGKGHEVWILTKPPTGIPQAYADKVAWVLKYLPEFKRKIILTHDKSLLEGDLLIDDRPHKANTHKFKGHLIIFSKRLNWKKIAELKIIDELAHGHPAFSFRRIAIPA